MIDEGRTPSSAREPATQTDSLAIGPLDAVWLLSSFAALHQQSCDFESLARECVPPMALSYLQSLGDRLGLNVSVSATRGFDDAPLAVQVSSVSLQQLEGAIVLAADATNVVVSFRSASAPTTRAITESTTRLTDVNLRVTSKMAPAHDPDIAASAVKAVRLPLVRAGIAQALAHLARSARGIAGVQLIALELPLFTQAIIDKVVVHQTQSTLITLAIGMAMFMNSRGC